MAQAPARAPTGIRKVILWIWWGGSTKPGPAWLAMLCLCLGFLAGVAFDMRFRQAEIIERVRTYIFGEKTMDMPRPVTPPPPGMAWAKVLTTGYCPCKICCEKEQQDWKTATNRDIRVHPYGIASAHQLVRPGNWLEIPGYGYAMVDDTGGAMRESARRGVIQLDLRFEEHQVARRWGRRWLWIAVPADSGAARLPGDDVAPAKRAGE